MATKYSEEQMKLIKDAQEHASFLLKNTKEFNKVFEEIFKKFDVNRDGSIGMSEYMAFLKCLFAASKKNLDLNFVMRNFERADKDKDGNIDKEEFKKELKKRLQEFSDKKVY